MREFTEADLQEPDKPQVTGSSKVLVLSLLGLAGFLAWQALALASFIREEGRPPAWDQAIHLEIAQDYRAALAKGDSGSAWNLAPKPGMPPFPPLYHLGMMGAYDTNNPVGEALWINWFHLALLCLSVFAISYHFRPDDTALAAAVSVGCAPIMQWMLKTQLVDITMASWAAAAYWALLKSDDFKKWPGSIAFGVAFGLGMMHKWSFFSFMIPAYAIGGGALFSKGSGLKSLVAWSLAGVMFVPWYVTHMPVLLPRLTQASADFGVPVWQNLAFMAYFLQSINSLSIPLWALGWAGLLIPAYQRNKERGWVLAGWILSSYLFWMFVSNRQMRFFAGALPAFGAVMACSAIPRPVIWGVAAFQIVTAINHGQGWIAPIHLNNNIQPIHILPSFPPKKEDWKIDEIVQEAQKRHDPSLPVGNLTLVANHVYFNAPNFTWAVKNLKLPAVRIRGVNKRLCEFAEFVVLKSSDLGSPGVIGGLPEASDQINRKDGWFQTAYEEVKRFPLPDRSEAVFYQQRKFKTPPIPVKEMVYNFFQSPAFQAKDLKVRFGEWDAARSVFKKISISASEVQVRGVTVGPVEAELEDALFLHFFETPPGEDAKPYEDIRFLRMGRLRIKTLKADGDEVRKFLEQRVRSLKIERLEFEGQRIVFQGTLQNVALHLEIGLGFEDGGKRLAAKVERLGVGATRLPASALGRVKDLSVPLEPNPETPFYIDLPGLTLKGNKISVP